MTNLEFMQVYNLAALELSEMTAEQTEAYIQAKMDASEILKIQADAGRRRMQELGKKARIQIHESDMRYIIPEQTLHEKIKEGKRVSKTELNDFLAELD